VRVVVLGGTTEARALSRALDAWPDVQVTVSLAGHTTDVADHGGTLRSGGFGGVDGLVRHLRDERVDVVVDATHPFAATMPANAAAACQRTGTPRVRLVRPPWEPGPDDRWIDADDLAGAAHAVERSGARRVLLTTGRLEASAFSHVRGVSFVVRTIEPPGPLPFPAEVLLARGPFTEEAEGDLLRATGAELLVTKNSGGSDAKLLAARRLGIPVVMVRRPAPVPGPRVTSPAGALSWLRAAGVDGE
jgi:precorrin-6A/cobalt-precorrin-6A reductase